MADNGRWRPACRPGTATALAAVRQPSRQQVEPAAAVTIQAASAARLSGRPAGALAAGALAAGALAADGPASAAGRAAGTAAMSCAR